MGYDPNLRAAGGPFFSRLRTERTAGVGWIDGAEVTVASGPVPLVVKQRPSVVT